MATTVTFRIDDETERALGVLTRSGDTRSAAIRQTILDSARRHERATEMRRSILDMDLGAPDGINVAEAMARER